MTLDEAINSKRETEERTIHLTKKEFDALMKAKYESGKAAGYWEGYKERQEEEKEAIA